MRWFRFYDDAVNDPKILRLSDKLFRAWVGLLCLASKGNGVIPALEDICVVLRMKPSEVTKAIDQLQLFGLIDVCDDELSPHNWNGRQYKSDVSTPRVKRFRERERNVSVTPPETEADTEQKDIRSVAKATRPNLDFENFKKCFPRRRGSNPWKPALLLFEKAVRAGTPAEMISRAAAAYGAECQRNGIVDTEKIAQAQTWLRQERYSDYVQANGADVVPIFDVRRHMI